MHHNHQRHLLPAPPLPCPPPPPPCTTNSNKNVNSNTIVIVGALHAVGAWLSVRLAGARWSVKAVAIDTDISTNQLLWYRRQQLSNAGVEVRFRNLSNSTHVESILSPPPSYVVYVPPVLDDETTPPGSTYWGSHMSQFISLLEGLKKLSPCTKFLLASQSLEAASHDSHMTIQQAHATAFEAALLTYHSLYRTQYTILRTGPAYGPWTQHAFSLEARSKKSGIGGGAVNESTLQYNWYITDISEAMLSVLKKGPFCDTLDLTRCPDNQNTHHSAQTALNLTSQQPVDKGLKKTLHWARAYLRQMQLAKDNENDVILTSYFTSREDFQRKKGVAPNRLQYMLHWLVSVRDLGLRAVVFHDQLDSGFCQRVIQYHPGLSFRRVPSLLNRTTNDARFYAFLDYLHTQPDLGRVLLTDISDVKFQRNPFQLMRLLGDWLYIGTDIDIFPNMASQRWISERLEGCFGNHTLLHGPLKPLMSLDTVYNAGVIGGTRHVMLALLERLSQYLDTTPQALNCNMPAVNFAVHRYFYQQVFTGFPLSSRFLRYQSSPKGVYVIHK